MTAPWRAGSLTAGWQRCIPTWLRSCRMRHRHHRHQQPLHRAVTRQMKRQLLPGPHGWQPPPCARRHMGMLVAAVLTAAAMQEDPARYPSG